MRRAFWVALSAVAAVLGAETDRLGEANSFVDETVAYAEKLAEKGWAGLALVTYSEALARAPTTADVREIHFRLGRLNFKRGAFKASAQSFAAFMTEGSEDERHVDALYWGAESHYALAQYQKALDLFDRCMSACADERDERYVHSKYGAGWCLYKLEEYGKAAAHFAAFADTYFYYKLAPEAQLALGRAHGKMKKYDDACRAFKLVVDSGGSPEQQAQAYLGIACARFDDDRYVEAMASLEAVLNKHRDSKCVPEARWWKARILEEWGDGQRANDVLSSLARDYPRSKFGREAVVQIGNHLRKLPADQIKSETLSEDHLYGLAEAAYGEGDTDRAVELYEQMVLAFPKGNRSADAHFRIGMCSSRAKDYAKAKEHFLRARAGSTMDEVTSEALYRAGQCAYRLKRYAEARELLTEAIDAEPSPNIEAHAQFLLGECLFQAGDYSGSAERQRQALALLADTDGELVHEAEFRLGVALHRAEQYGPATDAFRQFRTRFPENAHVPRAMFLEADSFIRQDKNVEAERLLTQYVERYPQDESYSQALLQLGYLAERVGRYDDALSHYWKLREAARDGKKLEVGQAEERICWALYRKGDTDSALRAFLALIRNHPDRKLKAETYNWIGLTLLRANRHRDAVLAFEGLVGQYAADKSKASLVEQAYYCAAQCHHAMGDEGSRLKTLQALVERFPKSRFIPAAKLAVADHCLKRGLSGKAELLYGEVARVSAGPLRAEALCKLGDALLAQRKHLDAQKVLSRVAALFDAPKTRVWALKARVGLGRCCEARGDRAGAVRHYRTVAQSKGEPGPVDEAKREAAARLLDLDEPDGPAEGQR